MICPKCGAKLAQGSKICPICGTRQRAASTGQKSPEHSGTGSGQHSADRTPKKVSESPRIRTDLRTDKVQPKKSNGLLIAVIIAGIILIGIVTALVVMLLQNRSGNQLYTVSPSMSHEEEPTASQEQSTEPVSEETSVEDSSENLESEGTQLRLDNNVYEIEDGEATLISWNQNSATAEIPSQVNGYPVTRIAAHAFQNSSSVQYLKLSKELRQLDTYSLYDCENLQEVVIPNSVEIINTYAFSRVKTAICVRDSFAYRYMQTVAEEVVEGTDFINPPGNTVVTTAVQTTTAAQAQTTTVAPVQTTVAPTELTTAAPTEPTPAPTEPTPAPAEPTTVAPTEPTPAPAEPTTAAPTEPTTAPAEPTTATPTEPTTAPVESTTAPQEASTAEPTTALQEEPTTEPTTEEPTPLQRSAETVKNQMAQETGGTVVDYQYTDVDGDGVEEAFAIVQASGLYSLWINNSSAQANWKIADFGEAVRADTQFVTVDGALQYVVNITTQTGSVGYIYRYENGSLTPVLELLPGFVTVPSEGNLVVTGSQSVAYLTWRDGMYQEYAAATISQNQFLSLENAQNAWNQMVSELGEEPQNVTFWNRANGMIQVSMQTSSGSSRYVNLWRMDGGVSYAPDTIATSGSLDWNDGVVAESYTGLPAIAPETIVVSLTSTVTMAEGSSYSYDMNQDGAIDAVRYQKLASGEEYALQLYVNDAMVYQTAQTAADYRVEICDLNSNDSKYQLIFAGVSGDNQLRCFEIGNIEGNSYVPLVTNGSLQILQTVQPMQYLYAPEHILTDMDSASGQFNLVMDTPVSLPNLGNYYCKVSYQYDGNSFYELSGGEYELLDVTSMGLGSYQLAADVNVLDAASYGANVLAVWTAGTQIFPRALAVNAEGIFVKAADASGVTGYLTLDQPLFTAAPTWH